VLGLKEWMWVNAGQDFCLFHAGDTRSRAELVEQLGKSFQEFSVVMISASIMAIR